MTLSGTPTPTVMDLREFAGLPAMGRFFQSGFNINALRTNTLLMKDDWTMLDERVVEVSSTILTGIADLEAFGLSFPNGGLGTMISQYSQASALRAATITMDPRVDAERDRRNFPLVSVPVPIIMCPFELNIRELAASRQHGHALDVTHIDDATRSVSEGMESLLFLGGSLVVQATSIYGYLTHPSRNTTSGADWGTSTNIYPNVLTMLGIMKGDGYAGPYRLYLHSDQFQQTLALNANTSTTILSTIESLPGFGRGSVREAQMVTAGQGVLVNMTRNCVDLSVGQETTTVEWAEKGGIASEYIVMACMVPRVKSTADGKSGICHISSI
jgi:uncharacterized linocin/CFP29 family protein